MESQEAESHLLLPLAAMSMTEEAVCLSLRFENWTAGPQTPGGGVRYLESIICFQQPWNIWTMTSLKVI